MPNDLSPCPDPTTPTSALLARAARYVRRAEDMIAGTGIPQTDIASALAHLARMQADLATARLAETKTARTAAERAANPFHHCEADLIKARAALSEAYLHSPPAESDDAMARGLIPHGSAENDGGRVRAVSACRAMLDLEALRLYLSDDALTEAIALHARKTGRADLAGVAYAALPDGAYLPCQVY